jgi:hypothetical protein
MARAIQQKQTYLNYHGWLLWGPRLPPLYSS